LLEPVQDGHGLDLADRRQRPDLGGDEVVEVLKVPAGDGDELNSIGTTQRSVPWGQR
jgi:hypothetical protein